jgi:hypothetical protein
MNIYWVRTSKREAVVTAWTIMEAESLLGETLQQFDLIGKRLINGKPKIWLERSVA